MANKTFNTRIFMRNDTTTNWTTGGGPNIVLGKGELGFNLTTKDFKIGDGVTVFSSLPYVLASNAVTGAMVYKGVIDCSTNPNYPAATSGDTHVVSVAGKVGGVSGITVEPGDMLICKTTAAAGDHATVGANWNLVQSNVINPVVSGEAGAVTANTVPKYGDTSGKSLVSTGFTLGSTVPANAKFADVNALTQNAKTIVTGVQKVPTAGVDAITAQVTTLEGLTLTSYAASPSNGTPASDDTVATILNKLLGQLAQKSAFAVCATAAATAAKAVTATNFVVATGSILTVKFTSGNSAAAPTLAVNGGAAAAINYMGSAASTTIIAANVPYMMVYNGTQWDLCPAITAAPGTVTSVAATVPLGITVGGSAITTAGTLAFTWTAGYQAYPDADKNKLAGIATGTVSEAVGVAAKTMAATGFIRATGSIVIAKFTNGNTAATPTLNVNATGATNIFYKAAAVPVDKILAGDSYMMYYDGTNYVLVDGTALADAAPGAMTYGTTGAVGTSNQVAREDHTHTMTAMSLAAGNGMNFTTVTNGTGTVTMGTPSDITGSSTNNVSAGTHTHALADSSVGVGEMAAISGSDYLILDGGTATSAW